MVKVSVSAIAMLLLPAFTLCGQPRKAVGPTAYTVDSSFKDQVEKKVKSYGRVTFGSMDFRALRNGIVIGDTYARGKSIDESIIMTSLRGDTVTITGFLGLTAAFGYQLVLYKDTCLIRHFAKTDALIYKYQQTDSLNFGVSVPCKTYKLTLTSQPTYKKGEVLTGIIELVSEDYYEVSNGQEHKLSVQLTGYFKTEPLETLEAKFRRKIGK